jgi:hypothetical protein
MMTLFLVWALIVAELFLRFAATAACDLPQQAEDTASIAISINAVTTVRRKNAFMSVIFIFLK